jgi:dienelactone hydrolase
MKSTITILISTLASAAALNAQGTLADYERGQKLQSETRGLVVNMPGTPNWIDDSSRFWYTRSVKGGTEFVLADASSATKKLAFDHDKLATAINAASGGHYTALTLPFAPMTGGRGGGGGRGAFGPVPGALRFSDNEQTVEFGAAGFMYICKLSSYQCTKGGPIPAPAAAPGRGNAPEDDGILSAPFVPDSNATDGIEDLPPQEGAGGLGFGRGRGQQPCAVRQQAPAAGRGGRGGRGATAATTPAEVQTCASFDGKWEALIQNYNVFLRPAGSTDPATPLSFDGSEGNYYTLRSVAWSPDSKKLAAFHTRPGYDRQVHYVESSPTDQLQPKHSSVFYRKPGDALDIAYPTVFDIATKKEVAIDNALFPNAYDLTPPVWWKDSRGFTFDYNQRGHQVYRVIEVDAQTGKARALITEESPTFIDYQQLPSGKRYRYALDDGKEIIWGSERDGWEHLYVYDGVTGQVKRQITKGKWVVRNVEYVDEEKKQITFTASGMDPEQDPYFVHYYRINFDGTGLTKLSEANGNHTVTFSRDRQYYVDSWSRVDQPPAAQLRRASDQKVIMDLEKADASALLAAGYRMPEVFVAKGRDGKTDIWGTIVRPTNFDASKKYPVVEQIYAGPQGSFVPKTFTTVPATQALAELGFIVVQIDGMGTNNRGKAFHNVAWKNLGDAGFPDRILWHKAAAAKYPWYDISRVGIYGTSAGGQNAMGAMLFHPEFYNVAVTNSGCHDNRMDKIWWNELWMGWPLGPEYAASSNVDNAAKLAGKVLIIIPEMDTNVDPSSSMQVVNALIKARKHFDMLVVPGQNHGAGSVASQHYLQDYFVHNLLGVEPPDWNRVSFPAEPATGGN